MSAETAGLAEARALLDRGDVDAAIALADPLTRHADPGVAGEAWLVTGAARYRSDDEPGALVAWRAAAQREGPVAWLGWRSVAEQLVRDGDLEGAIAAYREADRRAPAHERGAIANRIAWLLKETGHDFASRRQFNRARGAYAAHVPVVTYAIIAICSILFLIDTVLAQQAFGGDSFLTGGIGPLGENHLINTGAVAAGEWWRIFTSAFFHLGLIHLVLNMTALYMFGSIAERMYGSLEYLAIYLLCAAGGSVLTIIVDPGQFAAGASGAIFGIVGLLFVASQRHSAALGAEGRVVTSGLLIYLLVFTFIVPGISWTGHLGGLATGAALGWLLPPTRVATLASMWRTGTGDRLNRPMAPTLRVAVYVGVAALLAIGSWWAIGGFIG
jgi:membrane associated rhomboid family serine protease